jgi:hypothetical protein
MIGSASKEITGRSHDSYSILWARVKYESPKAFLTAKFLEDVESRWNIW